MIFLKHFRHFYIRYGWSFLFGFVILIIVDYIQLEIPRIIKVIIDGTEQGLITDIDTLLDPLGRIAFIVIAMTVGRFLWRLFFYGTSHRIAASLRGKMFNHLTTLDQGYYVNQKVGGLMAYFTNDINAIREAYGLGLIMLVDGVVLGTLVLVRMFTLQLWMTIIAFIPIALMGILVFFLEKKLELKAKEKTEAFESMSDFTQESFSGITVIKAYVREIAESILFFSRSMRVYKKTMSQIQYNVIVNLIIDVMITLVILSIIAYGSILIAFNQSTAGELTEYISYFFTLLWPVFALAGFINTNAQAQASAKRINTMLDTKPSVVDPTDAIKDIELDGSIVAKHLSFQYPDGQSKVLEDISFTIEKGEMVGILGKTGSGKSTLVEILLHLYNVSPSMLFFSGVDASTLSIETLRTHIGYVPQDHFLFSDTIANNIAFAFETLDMEKVTEAAKLADIDGNIADFKEGYQTMLGERGVTVSGGQKQRLAIARALIKDPAILILDDAVSAVDTKTEEAIIKNLKKIRKGKTTMMVAHRISTVKKLDKILLLDQGKLIGFGTHEQLLKSNSIYQDMVRRQTLETMVAEGTVHA
jgi:ATP-binding cassette, subfamily B, multidrug efflux pump